jgi:hypothetical protein
MLLRARELELQARKAMAACAKEGPEARPAGSEPPAVIAPEKNANRKKFGSYDREKKEPLRIYTSTNLNLDVMALLSRFQPN